MNYAQTISGSRVTNLPTGTTAYSLVTLSITTTGNPVQLTAYGDANGPGGNFAGTLQIFRDGSGTTAGSVYTAGTELGNVAMYESSTGNENQVYSLQIIDTTVTAGAHTYTLVSTGRSFQTQDFGEAVGPQISAIELSSARGATGATGPAASDTSAWSSYTVTWTGSTSNPVLGDGTLTGRYKTIGKTVFMQLRLQIGSSTSFGSGAWRFSLPVNAFSGTAVVLSATFLDNGTQWYSGVANTEYDSDVTYIVALTPSSGAVGPTTPFSWASTDSLVIAGSYESA
jgi:hypothetical protein